MALLTSEYLNYNPKVPRVLYHYCSPQSFLSIIENKNIWLSDASKTNDKTELMWLYNNVFKVITDILTEKKDEFPSSLLDEAKFCSRIIIDGLIEKYSPMVKNAKNLLVCFSEKKDLLSQWIAYANNGQGLAIGFNSSYLKQFASSTSYGFTKVIYREKDILSFLYKGLSQTLYYALQTHLEQDEKIRTDESFTIGIASAIYSILQEGFVFKHESFSEEKEWRILKRFTASNYNDSDGIDDYGYAEFLDGIFRSNENYFGPFSRSELKFRSTNNDIRTYMELGFDKIKTEFIKEIVIGPKCDISELDLRLLLSKNGYIDNFSSDKIKIFHSKAPYQ